MSELVDNLISVDKNREVEIRKVTDASYIVSFFEMTGPTGDKGIRLPDKTIMTEENYNLKKKFYDAQFEPKMLPFGTFKLCNSLEEAQKQAQYFIENL